MRQSTPYHVPREPGHWRAIVLAALVHVALIGFLWIGVRWQSETPVAIEAEVWSPQPREAAPPPPPEPPAEPVKQPEPPIPEPLPKPPVPEPPVVKPDIALEQEKKRKALEQKKREEAERLAKQEAERIAKQKEEAERQAKLKQEAERQAKLKQQEAQKQAEKEKAERERKLAEAKRKEQEEAYERQLAKMREEEMKRLAAGIAGTGGSGDAEKSQGGRADASYAQRVGAKIKSNTNFYPPENLAGNPAVEYMVELLPDGSVKGVPRKLKSSGVPGFDEAVLRAIIVSQPYPRNNAGVVPSSLIVSQKPKDQ